MDTETMREVIETFDTARRAMRESDYLTEVAVERFNRALVDLESDAWERGWRLAHDMRDRNEREWLAQYVLRVLGKDRADGEIDLGALGRWYAE